MKIGVFVTARLGSTRLSRKHLQKVKGREIMWYLIMRTLNEFSQETGSGQVVLCIVTGNKADNALFEKVFPEVQVFYGDDDNIPKRHLQAAEHFGVDAIVSVDGDDILCSPASMRAVYKELLNGAGLVKTQGLPFGLNSWGYSTRTLEQCVKKADLKLLETGWGRIFDSIEAKIIKYDYKDTGQLRFSLDYQADLDFFEAVISNPGFDNLKTSDRDLVELVLNKNLYLKNSEYVETYWNNFNEHLDKENEPVSK